MSGKWGEGREGRPRQSRIFRVLFGGWITPTAGERLNPVNRFGSPLDKKSRKTKKTFPPFPRLTLAVRNPHTKGCCFPGTRSVADRSVAQIGRASCRESVASTR